MKICLFAPEKTPEQQTSGRIPLPAGLLHLEAWLVGGRYWSSKLLVVSLLLLVLIVDYSRSTLASLSPGLLECLREPSRFAGIEVALLYVPVVHGPQSHADKDGRAEQQPRLLRTSLGFHELEGALPPMQEGTILSVRGRCTAQGTLQVSQVLMHPLRPVKEQVSSFTAVLLAGALVWRYLVPVSLTWLRRRRESRGS